MTNLADLPADASDPDTLPTNDGWRARLDLCYRRMGERTLLASRAHVGPLVVQKSLYPEGECVCQSVIIHPPGGMVGGDRLAVSVDVGPGAHAQLTTPGAAKCYRSQGPFALQRVRLHAAQGAVLEWLPQETIVYDGANLDVDIAIDLDADAAFMGWDVVCLGRTASGERFNRGTLRQRLALAREGVAIFAERAVLNGGGRMLDSPVGLHGHPVFGTFLAAAPVVSDDTLGACRRVTTTSGDASVTRLPGALIGRYRGDSAPAARQYFVNLWRALRPVLTSRAAVLPRIWTT